MVLLLVAEILVEGQDLEVGTLVKAESLVTETQGAVHALGWRVWLRTLAQLSATEVVYHAEKSQ